MLLSELRGICIMPTYIICELCWEKKVAGVNDVSLTTLVFNDYFSFLTIPGGCV